MWSQPDLLYVVIIEAFPPGRVVLRGRNDRYETDSRPLDVLFYLALSCTAKRSVKSQKMLQLPPGSESATGPGNPCKTNTNNKHSTWCDTHLVFYLSVKSALPLQPL